MIFGFNSEVPHCGRVYHVQSEVRQGEELLQTQIFVQGRCVVKRAASYADLLLDSSSSEEAVHEQLRVQHRHVVESVREGALRELEELESDGGVAPASVTPEAVPATTAIISEPEPLQLRFLSSARPEPQIIRLRFRLLLGERPVRGVPIMARLLPVEGAEESFHSLDAATALTEADGVAELSLSVPAAAHGESLLLAQVIEQDRRIVKRFRLRAAQR